MNKLMQRVGLFSFLGCLALIAMASQGNSQSTCAGEWNAAFKKQETAAIMEVCGAGHSWDLLRPGNQHIHNLD